MATARGIRAGRAFVELFADNSRLVRGLRLAERHVVNFGKRLAGIGAKVAATTMAAITPIAAITVSAASSAQETLSKFRAVFKDQADAAQAWADQLAASVGRSKFDIYDAMSTFQALFVGMGFGSDKAMEMSKAMQQLAIDFGSFHNISDAEAVERFISALSGSSEVLDRFGVNIKQAAMEQELLAMGVRKSWTEVTEQEKVLARLNIIARAMGDQGAIGDAVKTAGSFTNQMKRLRGQIKDASVAIGKALLPILTPIVKKMNEAAKVIGGWISRNAGLVQSILKLAAGVAAAGAAMTAAGLAVAAIGKGFGLLAPIVGALLSPIGLVISAVAALGGYLLYTTDAGGKALSWLGGKFATLRDDATSAYEGIAAALAAGDITLAARVLWTALKMEFQKGYNWVMQEWLDVKTFLLKTIQGAIDGAAAAWTIFTSWMRTEWAETVGFLQLKWARFNAQFERATTRTGSVLADWWLKIQESMAASPQEAERYRQAQQQLPQQTEAMLSKTSRDEAQRLEQIIATWRASLDRINAERDARLASIGKDYEGVAKALDQQRQSEIAALEADLAKARKDFDAAVADAKSKRGGAAAGDGDQAPGDGGGMGEIKKRIDDAVAQLGTAAIGAKRSIFGTFNASAAYGIGGKDHNAEIATNTKRTADGVDRLSRKLDKGNVYGA